VIDDHATVRTRLVHAREHLRSKVDGLHRQITHARSYVANPWIQFGAAVAVGYLLGRGEHAETIERTPEAPETIVHALVRTALETIVTSGIRRAMS
jgi:hypothetical protein